MLNKFKISTINCGLKYKDRDDLLLITLPENTSIAGVFTTSSMAAAPVSWCRESIKSKINPRALLVNAGNANAFTGEAGEIAVFETVKAVSSQVGCESNQVLVSSTGVIGEPLKFELICLALPKMIQNFCETNERWMQAAKAIMTTDTRPKLVQKSCLVVDKKVNLIGFAKGSGMIAPNMATMLGYVFCDANISSNALQNLLKDACQQSFNAITVDSDQSTNDTVLLFASGEIGSQTINDPNSKDLDEFKQTLNQLCLELAKMVVIDGEGAKKLIEIEVSGGASKEEAKQVAFAIANSPLVKTAIAGCDPNWGRIVMAVGKSCSLANQKLLKIWIGEQLVAQNGARSNNYSEFDAYNYLKNSEVKIRVDLGLGSAAARVWTCDFNEEYIHINKDYRS